MKKHFLLLIIIQFFHIGKSQEIDLSKWKRDSIPLGIGLSFIEKDKLYQTKLSKDNWSFRIHNDTVKIVNNDYKIDNGDSLFYKGELMKLPPRKYIKKVFNGYLIGINDNEYIGNSLKFLSTLENNKIVDLEKIENISTSKNYNNKRQRIISNNIRKIFEFNNTLYGFQGGGIIENSPGMIIEIFYKNGVWKYKNIKNIIEVPIISFLHNEKLYIITNQHILRMDKNMRIKQVLKSELKWGQINLSNAFIKNNDIFIAMRGGILIIRDFENNPNYEWFVK